MNRLKVWAFALLVLLAGAANLWLVTQWQAQAAVAEADAALLAAAGQLDARSQLLAAQAAGLAEAAARAPAVLSALAEGGGDPTAAATVAVAAARGMTAEAARALLVGTAGSEGARLRAGGKPVEIQDPAAGLFAEPLRGVRREGYAFSAEAVWFAVAVPAGKGAVVVGLPVDAAWAAALQAASGADVTLSSGPQRPVSTLGADAAAVASAARAALSRPVDAGPSPRVRTAVPGLPPVPLALARLPSHRALAVALRGTRAGLAVLSAPLGPRLQGLATYQVASAAALLLLLLAGLLFGLLMGGEAAPGVPRELVAAADRIQRGDFGARVPSLAGSLGTVASALNRLADAAQEAQAAAPRASPAPAPPADPFGGLLGHASEPDPFAPAPGSAADASAGLFAPPGREPTIPPLEVPLPARPAAPAPPAPEPPAPAASPPPAPAELFPPPLPQRQAPGGPGKFAALEDSISGATSLTTRAEDLLAASPTPAARVGTPLPGPPPDPDEVHWQEVFRDFLRVRQDCGESIEGLTFERFRTKLETSRASLLRKHDCRTVRFQVYVKGGKAALRATPMR